MFEPKNDAEWLARATSFSIDHVEDRDGAYHVIYISRKRTSGMIPPDYYYEVERQDCKRAPISARFSYLTADTSIFMSYEPNVAKDFRFPTKEAALAAYVEWKADQ